jgi:hypothetical protein
MGRNYNYGTPGVLNVGSYQIAGLPYLSGSEALAAGGEDRHSFDPLAKSVTVVNHGAHALRVSFAPTGAMNTPATTHHYITVSGSKGLHAGHAHSGSNTVILNGRMKDVYVSQPYGGTIAYDIYAELTNIASGEMVVPTGSGISD